VVRTETRPREGGGPLGGRVCRNHQNPTLNKRKVLKGGRGGRKYQKTKAGLNNLARGFPRFGKREQPRFVRKTLGIGHIRGETAWEKTEEKPTGEKRAG